RAAAAGRRLRPLLQQDAVQAGGHRASAADLLRVDRGREEADEEERRRLAERRRLRPGVRLLRRRAAEVHVLRAALRRAVRRREGALDPLEGSRLDEVLHLAEEPGRLVRLRQAATLPGGSRPGVLGLERVRDRQAGDE